MEYVKFESDKYMRSLEHVRVDSAAWGKMRGPDEAFTMLRITNVTLPFQEQADALFRMLKYRFEEQEGRQTPVFVRIFLSDVANQERDVLDRWSSLGISCAVSIVQQPPLDGTKIAAGVYSVAGAELSVAGALHRARIDGYDHYWLGNETSQEGDSQSQTASLLEKYENELGKVGCAFADNCVRTWFFVQNVDVNYHGVVVGRRENFAEIGLTEHTHYIASTGIEGRSSDPKALVKMDAYAIAGLKPGQQQYLYAKTHLNSTAEYGVTFERGVKVKYGDRSHLFISGTASIDNKGAVVHVGDIRKQTERMWENVQKLLEEGNASFDDVAHMIVYLRDVADYDVVKNMFEQRFPMVPKIFLLAPVCRPAWLIEMECMAAVRENNPEYPIF